MSSFNFKILGRVLSLFLLVATALGAQAKKYIVIIENPITYHMFDQAAKGVVIQNSQFQMLSSEAILVEKSLPNLQMAIIESDSPEAVALLKTKPGILDVEEEVIIPAPKPLFGTLEYMQRGHSPLMAANEVPWGIKAVKAEAAWKLSNGGKGVRVLVLDTGIDKDHMDIKGNFETGVNYAPKDSNNVPYNYFDTNGHGTHVAGTILADGTSGLVGVAPEATLLSARVCAARGCPSSAIISGVEFGIAQKVDVMNLSLGGPFPNNTARKAYEKADRAGIVVVAASGNDGRKAVGYPAAYPTTIAVGATDINNKKANFSNWGKELDIVAPGVNVFSSFPIGQGRTSEVMADFNDGAGMVKVDSLPMTGSAVLDKPLEGDLYDCKLGKSVCNSKGKIALIQRGEITFGEKATNAEKGGAVGVIVYNNQPGGPVGSTLGDAKVNIPVLMISMEDGQKMAKDLANIKASMGVVKSDFAFLQGTSMATPHVAGVAALIKATRSNLTPTQVRNYMKNTALKLKPNKDNEYGAGLVNAEASVNKAAFIELPAVSGL